MRRSSRFIFIGCLFASLSIIPGCGALVQPGSGPQTVETVELDRYAGLWYEVARSPNLFEFGCFGVTARYEVLDESTVSVENNCRLFGPAGPTSVIRGEASVVDLSDPAKLQVSFGGPPGDYWIIDLDDDYEWAVVSGPTRYLFILSRTPRLDDDTFNGILSRLVDRGFDLSNLIFTPQ